MTTHTIKVFKTLDELKSTPAAYADDAELRLTLAANTPYWIETNCLCYAWDIYGCAMYVKLAYTGTFDTTLPHHIVTYRDPVYYLGYYSNVSTALWCTDPTTIAAEAYIYAGVTNNAANRGPAFFSGRLNTLAGGVLSVQWRHVDNGFDPNPSLHPSKILAGSWMYATPLNIC